MAQPYQQQVDSLHKLLQKATSDTTRIRLLRGLALAYAQMNEGEKAIRIGNEALSLCRQKHLKFEEARTGYSLGTVYLYLQNTDSAIAHYSITRQLIENESGPDAKKLYARTLGNLSNAYSLKGFEGISLQLLISALPIFEEMSDTGSYAITLHNIANKFLNANEFRKAYPYFLKSVSLIEKDPSIPGKAGVYLSVAYLMLELDSMDRVKHYLDKAEQALTAVGQTREWSNYYAYKASYYTKSGKFSLADSLCRKAIAQQAVYPDRMNLHNAYSMLQENFFVQRRYREAKVYAALINRMAREDNIPTFLIASLHDLSDLSKKTGNITDAYRYLSEYTQLKDSIDKKEAAIKLSEMEMQFQSSRKEQQIFELQSRAKMQKLLLWGIVIPLILVILFFLYLFKQRKVRTLQQLQSLEQRQQIEVTQALLTGEEKERHRLARDLHDGLGGMLAGVKLNLSRMAEEEAPQNTTLHSAIDQLGSSVNELRRIARNMMPESLLKSGLQTALKELCENSMSPKVQIIFHAFNINVNIPSQIQIIIYRMIQEILGNAVKHSGASWIMVQCSQAEDTFFITVEDNGKGFDAAQEYEGMGLHNIRSRVTFLKGNIHIDSSDNGTIINIELNVAV